MFQLRRTSLLISAAVAGILAGQVAQADEVMMQVTRTSGDAPLATTKTVTTETKTITTSDPGTVVVSGQAIPLSVSEAAAILQTVDMRRAELDKKVVDARTSGALSESLAASMRRELDRIGAEVSVLKSQSSPSLLRSIALAQDLDTIAVTLKGSVTTIVYVPIIEGSHFTVFNGRIVQLDDLAVRRLELENRILAAQSAGKINYDQANHMRSELNAIAALEDAYKNTNGDVSFKNGRELYRDMDKVANELDRSMH